MGWGNNMKVYLVVTEYDYEGTNIHSIWSSLKKAEEGLKNDWLYGFSELEIIEWDVDWQEER